jgi:hypothetical protein
MSASTKLGSQGEEVLIKAIKAQASMDHID